MNCKNSKKEVNLKLIAGIFEKNSTGIFKPR